MLVGATVLHIANNKNTPLPPPTNLPGPNWTTLTTCHLSLQLATLVSNLRGDRALNYHGGDANLVSGFSKPCGPLSQYRQLFWQHLFSSPNHPISSAHEAPTVVFRCQLAICNSKCLLIQGHSELGSGARLACTRMRLSPSMMHHASPGRVSQESPFSLSFWGRMENHNITNDKSETHIGTTPQTQRPGQVDTKSFVDCASPSTPHPAWLKGSRNLGPLPTSTLRPCTPNKHQTNTSITSSQLRVRSLLDSRQNLHSVEQGQTLAAALSAARSNEKPRRSRPFCQNAHNQQHRSGNRTCEKLKTETEGWDQKGRTEQLRIESTMQLTLHFWGCGELLCSVLQSPCCLEIFTKIH